MKRAPLMLDAHFDPEVAPLLRSLGFDVVHVGRGAYSPTDRERLLLTINGMAQSMSIATTHPGPTIEVGGPLDADQQLDVARRFAALVWLDDDGELFLLDTGEEEAEA